MILFSSQMSLHNHQYNPSIFLNIVLPKKRKIKLASVMEPIFVLNVKLWLSLGQSLMVPCRWWLMVQAYHLTSTFASFSLSLSGISFPMCSSYSNPTHLQDPVQFPPLLEACLSYSCPQCPLFSSFLYYLPYPGV